MKLKFLSLVTAIFALCLTSCTNSGESPSDNHEHSFSTAWTHDETYHWHSATCGHEVVSGKAEHTFTETVINPTFEADGYTKHTCSVCGYFYSDSETQKLPHNYSADWTHDEQTHWHACIDSGYEALKQDETEHTMVETTVAPTYESQGYHLHECSVCGYSYKDDYVDALEHSYSFEWSHDESTHWHSCIDSGFESLKSDEATHTFIDEVTPATGQSGGYTTHTCSVCGYSYTDSETDPLTYTITWKNYDGTILETDTDVAYGSTPTYDGATPTKSGTAQYSYTFSGWSPSVTEVTGDATYVAQFSDSINSYTITWKNYDGTILETDNNVAYGSTPTYDGETPVKDKDAQYSYAFSGWSPSVTEVTGDATYTATFSSSVNSYTITWKNWDGTILETDNNVAYGSTPTYDGETPARSGDSQCSYVWNGWTPSVTSVTSDVTYTATFNELIKWDGTSKEPSTLKKIDDVYYYCISSASELAYLSQASGDWLSYNYVLTNDIILNDIELTYDENGDLTADTSDLLQWTMISGFSGIFDGAGYTIYGLYMDGNDSQAFFDSVVSDISNLNFVNSYVRSKKSSAAGICLTSENVGTNITHCSFSGCVNGTNTTGGILSLLKTGYLKHCTNRGDIFCSGNTAGGIVGAYYHYSITGCTNYGDITSSGDYVGGICGHGYSFVTYSFYSCENYGNIIGNDYVGGLCGDYGSGNGNNYGNVTGNNYVGGLVGRAIYSKSVNGMSGNNYGDVTGKDYVGGLLGYLKYYRLSDSNNYANVTGSTFVGGLVGYSDSIWGRGEVTNCFFTKTDSINTNLLEFGNSPEE